MYSVFSTENETRVDIYLIIQIRLPQGGPWGSWGPLGRSPNNLMIQTCWVSTLPSFLTENESRIDIYLRFQIRIPQGGPWGSRGLLGRSPKYLINIRQVGYKFYSVFSTENKSRVDTSLRFQIRLQQGDPWGSLGTLGGRGLQRT